MTYHYLQIVSYEGEAPSLRFVCTAPPDAQCRRRPDDDRESWDSDDPDLTSGHECWAVEWIEDDGWESVATETDGTLFSVGVQVYYDEGPVINHVSPVVENADTSGVSVEPSDAEIDAAARAVFETRDDPYDDTEWGELTSADRERWECYARAALVAARKVSGR